MISKDTIGYYKTNFQPLNKALLYAYHIVHKGLSISDTCTLYNINEQDLLTCLADYLSPYDSTLFDKCMSIVSSGTPSDSEFYLKVDNTDKLISRYDLDSYNMAVKLAMYKIDNDVSINNTAKHFNLTESDVQHYFNTYLKYYNPSLHSRIVRTKRKPCISAETFTAMQAMNCELASIAVDFMLSNGLNLSKASRLVYTTPDSLENYITTLLPLKDYVLYEKFLDLWYNSRGVRHKLDKRPSYPIKPSYPTNMKSFATLLLSGISVVEIAKKLDIRVATVYEWTHKYLKKADKESYLRVLEFRKWKMR